MKFYETHFEEYILENKRVNLHPKLDAFYKKLPASIHELKNIIFYGPPGAGKYTQVLKFIKKYSPSELKYEKKITLTFNKQTFFFKISDIHIEVDMSLLGCNSKLLWHDIYQQMIDIISAKTEKTGIIVCKCFHEIHSELLDNFYSYMQKNFSTSVELKFFIITKEISFIPDNILNCCEIIPISRASKSNYQKIINKPIPKNTNFENILNIKNLHIFTYPNENSMLLPYKIICNKIIESMINVNEKSFLYFRDLLYDLLIYHLDITECVWYILSTLVDREYIHQKHLTDLLIKTFCFFQYYNNNYRPIYHLENYFLSIVKIIHQY